MDIKNTEDEIFDHVLQHWGPRDPDLHTLPGLEGTQPHQAVLADVHILKFVDITDTPHQGALVAIGEDALQHGVGIEPDRIRRRLADHFEGRTIQVAILAPPGVAVPSKVEFFAPGEPSPADH